MLSNVIKVVTKSGSVYEIDPVNVAWARHHEGYSAVRTDGGKLMSLPEIKLGHHLYMVCPPLVEGDDVRIIQTSAIIDIDWGENDPLQYSHGSLTSDISRQDESRTSEAD